MTEPIVVTAPERLRTSVEEFISHAKEQDNTSFETLRQTIIDFSNAISNGVKGANEFFKPDTATERKEFFAELVRWSNTVLADACNARGITTLLDTTATGIQGAGKGTYNDEMGKLAAEFAQELSDPAHGKYRALANKYPNLANKLIQKSQTVEVKVGTGGIFAHKDDRQQITNHDELEYFELFNPMKKDLGSASGKLVEDNIVAISTNLYMAYKMLQNPNGISSFNLGYLS